MNLTILALQTSIISMSPLFTGIQSLNIKKSSFSYLISPLMYNNIGKIEHSSFINGLSSLIIIEKEDTVPVNKTLSRGESFQFVGNDIRNSGINPPLIFLDGDPNALDITISENLFYNCKSDDERGLIVISCQAKTSFTYNCFASCYSNGATTLCISSPGTVSFITSISEFHSNADCSFKVDNQGITDTTIFNNVNISNSNLMEYGAFFALSGSKLSISFLHFESSYNIHCFKIENNAQIAFKNCELFDLTAQLSIFSSMSSFNIENSYFFGLVFENLIESPSSLKYIFSNCGFDVSNGLIKESFIEYVDCYFDVEITFTNNAEFLNLGNCNGRNFTTYESILKQFSTEEILGMIFCSIGIILSVIMIVAKLLNMKKSAPNEVSSDVSFEDSDFDLSISSSDEEQEERPKKRK